MKLISLGQHHLVEFYDCCVETINNVELVRRAMVEAAKMARATIVAEVFHEFNPHGVSGVVVIAESHFAIHSWPEHRCVSIDLFTCSENMDPQAAFDHLAKVFKAQKISLQTLSRGEVVTPGATKPL
ncbi:MAG: adenosylmethionine decarboxylase [Pseudobdellovibrionaceae bacterium]